MVNVSLIVLNYNGQSIITDCLSSIETQSFRDFELIIVDNNSIDNSRELIKGFKIKSRLKIKTVYLSDNKGFAGGNMEGLRRAEGKYVALLNNDTEADKDWLSELVRAMDSHPDIGICASKMIVWGTDVIDSAGDGYSTALKGFKRGEGEEVNTFNMQEYVFGACAGAALYRTEMLDEIGFLDDDFFLIQEDTDLNLRAQLAGWKVLYVPMSVVYHKVRSTIGQMSDMATYYSLRNAEFVRAKNVPIGILLRCFLTYFIGLILEFIYFAIKHKKLRLYFKAKVDALKMLPQLFEKRRKIMKNKKVSNSYLLGLMASVYKKDFFRAKIKKFLHA